MMSLLNHEVCTLQQAQGDICKFIFDLFGYSNWYYTIHDAARSIKKLSQFFSFQFFNYIFTLIRIQYSDSFYR